MHFRVVWNEIEQNHFGLLNMLINQPTLVSPQITNVHSSRALDVQFLDAGTVTSVKVSELREIPPRFLQEMISVPPQVLYVQPGRLTGGNLNAFIITL